MIVSLSAGIIAMSSFYPQATVIVNATPGLQVRMVELTADGDYIPANTFLKSFRATSGPRIITIRYSPTTIALCAETIPQEQQPNTLAVRYRSCSLFPPKPTTTFPGLKGRN